jgi:hypothetical protein
VAIYDQFGAGGEGYGTEAPACAICEALLPEAVDGSLSAAEQAMFDRHVASCADCARELEEAQRGAAWLSLLKSHAPEPPAALLERILADTTGAHAASKVPMRIPSFEQALPLGRNAQPAPAAWAAPRPPKPSFWAALRSRLVDSVRIEHGQTNFHPRFAMTAAMAFFSLALTLNMAGVHLRDLRADDFTASGLRRAVADAGASAERRFQNLRVVYQMESRVEELRGDDKNTDGMDQGTAPAPEPSQGKAPTERQDQRKPEKPHGSSLVHEPTIAAPETRTSREAIS